VVAAGSELAGEVVAIGPDVEGWQVGDRVMGRGRGYAELAVVQAQSSMAVPPALTWEQAGGLPVALMTMHDALRTRGSLTAGRSVLINAATSGVGVTGVQLAALFGASVVIATSRHREKLRILEEHVAPLPCPLVGVGPHDDLGAVVRDATQGRGVDIVVDNVGGTALAANLDACAVLGTIVQVGRLGGRTDTLDLDELARKRVSLVGVTFRTRSEDEVVEIVRRCVADVAPHWAQLVPRVAQVFPLRDAMAAQDAMAENAHVGKLILVP
jgi:NADPH:quinone reductase-like Zn-dependent oxidoreductase